MQLNRLDATLGMVRALTGAKTKAEAKLLAPSLQPLL